MDKYKNILAEIIKGKTQWPDLKTELSKYNIHKEDTSAGKIFEVFTKYYFLTAPEHIVQYDNVWLYDDIPLKVKEKLDLGKVEYGIDLLLKSSSEEYIAVQCKFKNDESSKLSWSSDKIANLFAYCPKADGYIVSSNCADIDDVSKSRHDNFTFIGIGDLLETEPSTFANITSLLNDEKNRGNEKNGLLLSLILHKCFDTGLISIDDNYRVIVSYNIEDINLKKYLNPFRGKKIMLPPRKKYYPDKELLKKHREKFKDYIL